MHALHVRCSRMGKTNHHFFDLWVFFCGRDHKVMFREGC